MKSAWRSGGGLLGPGAVQPCVRAVGLQQLVVRALLDAGALNQDEFEAAKAKLLQG